MSPIPRRLRFDIDEEFMSLTLEDIKENIEAVVKSRARRPVPRVTQIYHMGRVVVVTVSVRQPPA